MKFHTKKKKSQFFSLSHQLFNVFSLCGFVQINLYLHDHVGCMCVIAFNEHAFVCFSGTIGLFQRQVGGSSPENMLSLKRKVNFGVAESKLIMKMIIRISSLLGEKKRST